MKIKKSIAPKFLLLVLAGLLFYSLQNMAFAAGLGKPDLVVTINNDGSTVIDGNLFDELLYPGHRETGVIRIVNNYTKINISELALKVKLNRFKPEYDGNLVYDSFLDHMRLTVNQGEFFIFDKTLAVNKPLRDFLFIQGDDRFGGFKLEPKDQFTINKYQSVDLKYVLCMDEEAGNELESVSASVKLLVNGSSLPCLEGRVTGGGALSKFEKKVTFGLTLYDDISNSSNNLEINWGKGDRFHLDKLLSINLTSENGVYILKGTGTGKYNDENGAFVEFEFTDAGEPGSKDFTKVIVKNVTGDVVLSVSGNLQNGNLQAHIK